MYMYATCVLGARCRGVDQHSTAFTLSANVDVLS